MSEDTQVQQDGAATPQPIAIVPPPPPAPPPEPAEVTQGTGATFDSIVAGDDEDAPSTDGLAVLAELGNPLAAGYASAADSYGYDRNLANNGKWFTWPKLGPSARVKLLKIGCPAWKVVADRAREKYGDDTGAIKSDVMDRILEPMMAKAAFVDMENVVVEVGADPLKNTEENRLRLMEQYTPELRNDLWKVCNNPKNFKDLSEEVLGN